MSPISLLSSLSSPFKRRLRISAKSIARTRSPAELTVDPIAAHGIEGYIDLAYQLVLGRHADADGLGHYGDRMRAGEMSDDQFISALVDSPEFKERQWSRASCAFQARKSLEALHGARLQIIASLPRVKRILDLGGSAAGRPEGALITYGYPYSFESLTIVDLPREERHQIYADICGEYHDVVPTPQGPVNYVYSSLADLSAFADASFDLVYSGQSIEHVTREDADRACREVYRVLKPGGWFCLDTPNRAVTRIQCPNSLINPDHDYEYTHIELSELLTSHGFAIEEAKGAALYARSVERGVFEMEEGVRHGYLYDDIERCYLLYYRCRKA